MSSAVIFAGLACGLLLVTGAILIRGRAALVPGLPRAARSLGWLSAAGLAIAAGLAWAEYGVVGAPAPRLHLIAALAAPVVLPQRRRPVAASVMPTAAALAVAVIGIFWTWTAGAVPSVASAVPASADSLPSPSVTIASLVAIICAGLAVRALGQALSDIIDPALSTDRRPALVYGPLTVLVAGVALVNLWSRGEVWAGTRAEVGIASAYLAWSGVWLSPSPYRRLRPVSVVAAAFLLIWVVLALV